MSVRQFVSDWNPDAVWTEWQFSGWQEWGGEQPEEMFWTPYGKDKDAFSFEPLEELYDITKLKDKSRIKSGRKQVINSFYGVQLKQNAETCFEIEVELVSILDSPNRVQLMIRCPMTYKTVVEPCVNKDFKFIGRWPTEYAEYILKKPTRYSESY